MQAQLQQTRRGDTILPQEKIIFVVKSVKRSAMEHRLLSHVLLLVPDTLSTYILDFLQSVLQRS